MAKKGMKSVVVLATIQCLVDGKSARFLPSEEPQEIPSDAANEAIERGLAKENPTARRKTATKTVPSEGESDKRDTEEDGLEGSVNI